MYKVKGVRSRWQDQKGQIATLCYIIEAKLTNFFTAGRVDGPKPYPLSLCITFVYYIEMRNRILRLFHLEVTPPL